MLSQTQDHAPYGGVVPEIAARAHVSHLDGLIARAMAEAGLRFADLDGVAATAGPGLLGGVIVGLTTAKAIALAHDKPLLAVNHLEGHALTARLLQPCAFPYLLLLISGGHTQFQIVDGVGRYHRLGTTIDDALGEAFDKVAKLLGLGYPGGPQVERQARAGDPRRFDFPRPLKGRKDCNFSFSGLKTAVREAVHGLGSLSPTGRRRCLRQLRGGRGRDHGRPAAHGGHAVPRGAPGSRAAGADRGGRRCRQPETQDRSSRRQRPPTASISSCRRPRSAPTMPP